MSEVRLLYRASIIDWVITVWFHLEPLGVTDISIIAMKGKSNIHTSGGPPNQHIFPQEHGTKLWLNTRRRSHGTSNYHTASATTQTRPRAMRYIAIHRFCEQTTYVREMSVTWSNVSQIIIEQWLDNRLSPIIAALPTTLSAATNFIQLSQVTERLPVKCWVCFRS